MNQVPKVLLLLGTIVLVVGCSRKPADETITRYLHDESVGLMSGVSNAPTKVSFSELLIFETGSRGMDTQIFESELDLNTAIFRSSAPAVIGEFIDLLSRGKADDPPTVTGKTYHIVLRLKHSSEAYFIRIFVDTNGTGAYLRAGTDPSLLQRNDAFLKWLETIK